MSHQRVAIITGSSRGIGRAIAKRLADDGWAVVVNYAHRKEAAEDLANEITQNGGRAAIVGGSVASNDTRAALVGKALEQFGRLDAVINNAGVTSPGRLDVLEATEDNWEHVFDINLKGAFFLAQAAANAMIDLIHQGVIENGYLVNISSVSAYSVSTNRADYCMTKAAMQMMTWLFASRLAEENIRVYEVCPGVIASDMTAPVKEKYDRLIADGLTPIRRWGQPEDVAQAVSVLVSGALPFSTGERINVDGGFHIRRL